MAKHTTHKNTPKGHHTTVARRAARAAKHYSPPLDTERLERELSTGGVR